MKAATFRLNFLRKALKFTKTNEGYYRPRWKSLGQLYGDLLPQIRDSPEDYAFVILCHILRQCYLEGFAALPYASSIDDYSKKNIDILENEQLSLEVVNEAEFRIAPDSNTLSIHLPESLQGVILIDARQYKKDEIAVHQPIGLEVFLLSALTEATQTGMQVKGVGQLDILPPKKVTQ